MVLRLPKSWSICSTRSTSCSSSRPPAPPGWRKATTGTARASTARSTGSAFNCHLTDKAAGDLVAVGRNSGGLPESAQAMQAGEIGYSHLVVLARTAEAVGKAFDETKLLKLAREHTPGRFYFKCQHYRHSLDAKGYAQEQADL